MDLVFADALLLRHRWQLALEQTRRLGRLVHWRLAVVQQRLRCRLHLAALASTAALAALVKIHGRRVCLALVQSALLFLCGSLKYRRNVAPLLRSSRSYRQCGHGLHCLASGRQN